MAQKVTGSGSNGNPLAYAIATYSPSASPAPTAPVLPASPQAPNADGNNDEKASTPPPPLPFPTASSLQASTSDFDKANTFLYSLILTHLKDDASYILDTVPSLNGYAAKVRIHGSGSIGLLRNVKHVPALKVNLLSVSRLTSSGFLISFYPRHCILKRNDLTIRGPRIGNLYHLPSPLSFRSPPPLPIPTLTSQFSVIPLSPHSAPASTTPSSVPASSAPESKALRVASSPAPSPLIPPASFPPSTKSIPLAPHYSPIRPPMLPPPPPKYSPQSPSLTPVW
eukprot:CAMPEP_0167746052 /NCGR_PEP_ID=MMETSP0110_2-20121227/3495_1 /TAXON_ID=629695 /ORGANISM="Gymnochlora sp., Strain CCMP2014" /LENGTH=281 /DNA_ID=CAMNT_0007630767 /DNA_START=981 /DNA_END=1824 /DNA_ORIENTATION=-